MTACTPEHEAALDALEEMVRENALREDLGFSASSEWPEDLGAITVLVTAGRMVWADDSRTHARFVPKPKPRLTDAEVETAVGLLCITQRAKQKLRTYLTSLTQEGESCRYAGSPRCYRRAAYATPTSRVIK